MFKNYVRNRTGKTPVNLAVARMIFCLYLVWKVASVHWERLYEWEQVPGYEHANLQNERPDAYSTEMVVHLEPLVPNIALANAHYLQFIAILLLVLLAIGYRIRFTGFVASFLVTYLGIMHAFVDHSWSTQILPISGIILMLFALYAEEDVLSHDGLRRHSKNGLDSLNNRLQIPLTNTYKSTPLGLLLVSLGVLYFGSGVGKLVQSGSRWVVPWNLGRSTHAGTGTSGYLPWLGDFVRQFDILLVAGGAGTLIVEFGFILAILTGKFLTVMILGLIIFHVGVALTMGPVFIYTVVFLLLFLDFEKFMRKIQLTDDVVIKYNENCSFCVKTLYIFKHLDVHNRLRFKIESGSSDDFPTNGNDALYVHYNGRTENGIAAIQRLCKCTVILYPLISMISIPPLSLVTHKLYTHFSTPISGS